mgnify:CR=1 FL=1
MCAESILVCGLWMFAAFGALTMLGWVALGSIFMWQVRHKKEKQD